MECKNSPSMFYITPKKYVHYLIIYLMISLNGAFWFYLNQDITEYVTLALYLVLSILYKRFRIIAPLMIVGFLLYTVVLVRLVNVGGIGFQSWYLWSGQILIVFVAYLFNREKFLERYVKMIFALSVISLIFWIVSLVSPNLLTSLFTANDAIAYNGTFYGKWFYVYRTSLVDVNIGARNSGIFSEPGRYQTVLISCIYMLLFQRDKLNFSKRTYSVFFVVILGTIVSVASTTGFIGLFILISFYLLKTYLYINRSNDNRRFSRNILFITCILMIAILVDINMNGDNSLYSRVITHKFEEASSDSSSSGGARVNAINVYLGTMVEHPFGAGYGNLNNAVTSSVDEANVAGAGLMSFFAAVGIIPSLIMLCLISYPFFMGKQKRWIECVAFLAIYINIGFSQTYAFYPSLLIIPIILYFDNRIILDRKNILK